jgi:predicted DNA-binding transcriptional regulator AlpA
VEKSRPRDIFLGIRLIQQENIMKSEFLLYTIRDLQDLLRVKKSSAYELIKEEGFPFPINLNGKRLVRWKAQDIERWVSQHASHKAIQEKDDE